MDRPTDERPEGNEEFTSSRKHIYKYNSCTEQLSYKDNHCSFYIFILSVPELFIIKLVF